MRAFIFSLDAFVAFTLALIAIYSLIFFSSIPSSYYYLLTQGHFLSRDVLMTLSTTECTEPTYICRNPGGSLIDNLVSQNNSAIRSALIDATVGKMVPAQFGYTVEMSDDLGVSWQLVYDTTNTSSSEPGDPHAKSGKKLSVSSQVLTFGYSNAFSKPINSTYSYLSCDGGAGELITCGLSGAVNPTGPGGADLVPSADVRLVKLTVFI